jgi:hypothetical protein
MQQNDRILLSKVLLIVFLCFLQLFIYLFTYWAGEYYWINFVREPSKVFGWIMQFWMALIGFSFIGSISLIAYILNWKIRWYLIVGLFLLYSFYFVIIDLSYTPYRSSLLFLSALNGLLTPIVIYTFIEIIRKKNNKKKQESILDSDG